MKDYWDRKILTWEAHNYNQLSILNPFSYALRKRQSLALKQIHRLQFEHCRVFEFACGSGVLAARLGDGPPIQYSGFDISITAIERARVRPYPARVKTEFHVKDLANSEDAFHCDLAVALGFTDWISISDFARLIRNISCRHLIVSYTENLDSLSSQVFTRFHRHRSAEAYRTGFPLRYKRSDFEKLLIENGFLIESVQGAEAGLGIGRLVLAKKS